MATYDSTIVAWGQVAPDFDNDARIYTLDGAFVTKITLSPSSGGGIEVQIATRHSDNHVFFEVPGVGFYEFDENLTPVTSTAHLMAVDFNCQLLQFIGARLWVGGGEADFSSTVYKKNSTSPYATVTSYTNIGSNATRLIEVDPTETYVYFSLANTDTRNVLNRYKFSDASEAAIITYGTWTPGTSTGYDILSGAVFPNGDIALVFQHQTAGVYDGAELVIFNSAGTVLHTITLPIEGGTLSYHVNTRLSYDGSKVFTLARHGDTSQYRVRSYLHATALVEDDFSIGLVLNDGSFEPMPEVAPDSIVDGGDDFSDACVTASTKIANKALANLGHSAFLADISTDESAEAEQCRLQYEDAVLEVLNEFPWPFATRYAALELRDEAADDPINPDWRFVYRLPADCVSPRRLCSQVNGQRLYDPNPIPFRRFNDDDIRLLFTNAETSDELPLTLEYTYRPECVATSGDPLFKRALQWYLSALLAPSLSKNKITAAECMSMFQATVTTARNVALNEQQVQANTNAGDAPWIADRG